jgi:hypothetical protein
MVHRKLNTLLTTSRIAVMKPELQLVLKEGKEATVPKKMLMYYFT